MKEMISILFSLFLMIMPSLSGEAQIGSRPVHPQGVTEEEVKQFLDEYANLYMAMDFEGFMALFSEGAVENRMFPYADIQRIYQKHFGKSRSLQYTLKILTIQNYAQSAFVSGRYQFIQTPKRGRRSVYQGSIQFDLVRENGSLKIRELNYSRDKK